MAPHRRGPWSQAEDARLLALVQVNGPSNWVRISQQLQTRSPKQCRERYHQNLKLGLNHSPITPEEGRTIENFVQTIGKRWAEIARRMPGRSDNAVKNWWNGGQNRRRRQNGRISQSEGHIQHQPVQPTPQFPLPQFNSHVQITPRVGQVLPLPRPYSFNGQQNQYSQTNFIDPSPVYSHNPLYAPKPRPEQLDLFNNPSKGHFQSNPFNNHYPTPGHSPALPSPSSHSNHSIDAPSLVSDTSISPRESHSGSSMAYDGRDGRRSSVLPYLPMQSNGYGNVHVNFDAYSRPDMRSMPASAGIRQPWNAPRRPPASFGHTEEEFAHLPMYANSMAPSQQGLVSHGASSPPGMRVGNINILNEDDEATNLKQHQHQHGQTLSSNGHPSLNGHSSMNGHSSLNGRLSLNGHSSINGYSTSNGHSSLSEHSSMNGHSALNGHSSPSRNSSSNGNSSPNGSSSSNGNSPPNGHPPSSGNSPPNGHPSSNRHSSPNGHPSPPKDSRMGMDRLTGP